MDPDLIRGVIYILSGLFGLGILVSVLVWRGSKWVADINNRIDRRGDENYALIKHLDECMDELKAEVRANREKSEREIRQFDRELSYAKGQRNQPLDEQIDLPRKEEVGGD